MADATKNRSRVRAAVDETYIATAEEHGVVQVFGPHDAERPPLVPYVRELWRRRRFLEVLAKTRLQAARNNTFAGQLWAVLDPLLQAGVYFLLIGLLRGGAQSSAERLVLLIGQVFVFTYTAHCMNYGSRSVSSGANLLLNARFPRALLPVAAVYRAWLEFLPSMAIYAVVHVASGRPIGAGISLIPLLFLLQTMMGLGLALLLSTAQVFIKDISSLLGYVIRIMLFSAPIIYPIAVLTPNLLKIVVFNPIYPLHASWEAVLTGQMPSASLIAMLTAWSLGLLASGTYVFLSKERLFALEL